MKAVNLISAVLVIVGALNWGMVGAAKFDLVAALLGAGSALSAIVYILVGLAGIYQALQLTVAQRTAQSVVYMR